MASLQDSYIWSPCNYDFTVQSYKAHVEADSREQGSTDKMAQHRVRRSRITDIRIIPMNYKIIMFKVSEKQKTVSPKIGEKNKRSLSFLTVRQFRYRMTHWLK